MKLDPATWREAARQLREEAGLSCAAADEKTDAAMTNVLLSMARRFENEAKAAEKAKEGEGG